MAKREQAVQREQYWRLVLAEFTASGLSVREFCRREGLREPSFYSWRRELRKRDGKMPQRARPQTSTTPALVEVMTRPAASVQSIEIETPAGLALRHSRLRFLPNKFCTSARKR